MDQVQEIFSSMQMPKSILVELRSQMKSSHSAKNSHRDQMINDIQRKYKMCDTKLSNLLDLRINNSITQDEYDKKATDLRSEKATLENKISSISKADEEFEISVNYLLNLAHRAGELFQAANIEQKRQLLNIVLSNLEVDGQKLHYQARKPFDILLECGKK